MKDDLKYLEIKNSEITFCNFNEEFSDEGQVTFSIFRNGITIVKGNEKKNEENKIVTTYKNNKIKDDALISKIQKNNPSGIINFVKTGPIFLQCE